MIRANSCAKAQIIYTRLQESGLKAEPVSGTPLSTLVEQGVSPVFGLPSNTMASMNTADITSMISDVSSKGNFGVDEHAAMSSDTVKMVSSVVKRTLQMARNIALPLVDDIVEQVDTKLKQLIPATGLALTIRESPVVKLLTNSTLTQVVSRYELTSSNLDADNVPVHALRSPEEIYELIKVGFDDFDADIKKFLIPYLGDETISKLYNKVFAEGANNTSMSSVVLGDDNLTVAAKAIICLLIGSALSKAEDDNINMNSSSYDYAMSNLLRWCGRKIIQAQKQVEFRKGGNIVVISYPERGREGAFLNPESAVIVVDPVTYETFLNEGGTPEIIMGSYLTDRNIGMNQLLGNSESYVKAYNTTVAALKSETKNQELTTMKRAIQVRVSHEIARATGTLVPGETEEGFSAIVDPEVIGEGLDTELNTWDGLVLNNPDAAQKLLIEKINNLNYQSVINIYSAVRDIVLDIFFNDTDVRRVLDIIDSYDKEDDVQAVVNLAVVDYVCGWVIDQISISE